jgi:predicted short-subunit dehydrogenase-like oxidoreductase (DUF2520 family)
MNRTINIIGCGRAASSLARLWRAAGTITIGRVLNRSEESARRAVSLIGEGEAAVSLRDMDTAEAWLIGTGDGQIQAVARELAASRIELGDSLVFHLAGRFGLSVLEPLDSRAAAIASLHPVRSLTHEGLTLEDFHGTACVAEGGPEALRRLKPLVTGIGGHWLPVDRIDRGLYHASVAIISNITKAIAWKAQKWQVKAGLPQETAATVTHQLLNSTMEDLFRSGARQSITGPIVRGDTSTIEAHLAALRAAHPDDIEIYRILARTVLELAQDRGDLDEDTLGRFQELFRSHSGGD